MKIKEFTSVELQNYFDNNQTVFINYKRLYYLTKTNKGFKFIEDKSKYIKNGLPYTLRGRFFACKPTDKYIVSLSETAPTKILLDSTFAKNLNKDDIKANELVRLLITYGFNTTVKDINKVALKDLHFKGNYIKQVGFNTNNTLYIQY